MISTIIDEKSIGRMATGRRWWCAIRVSRKSGPVPVGPPAVVRAAGGPTGYRRYGPSVPIFPGAGVADVPST